MLYVYYATFKVKLKKIDIRHYFPKSHLEMYNIHNTY